MEYLIDPLKIHTLGVKKPLEFKGEKLQSLQQDGLRYYPTDQRGNVDEWGAVIKRQAEAHQAAMQERQIQKVQAAKQYGDELTIAMKIKVDRDALEKRNRLGERDNMLRAVAHGSMQDQFMFDNHRQQQRMFGEAANQLISQKNQHKTDARRNDVMSDKQMIEQDNFRAMQIQDQQQQIKERQRQVMRDENLKLMNQRRDQVDMDRSFEQQPTSTSPTQIGEGYRRQLAAMQEQDRIKSMQMQQFAAQMNSQTSKKELHDMYNANNIQANQGLVNQRATAVQDYQARVKAEHKNSLIDQLNADRRQKQILEQTRKQDEAIQAQQAGIFNAQFEQRKQQARDRATIMYKQELDQQIQGRQAMKSYGNMTAVEKGLNKDDLKAYQKYDNNQYSMIPGIANTKKFAEPRPEKISSPVMTTSKGKAINEAKLRVHEERLAQYGLIRTGVQGNTRHGYNPQRSSLEIQSDQSMLQPLQQFQTIPGSRATPQPRESSPVRAAAVAQPATHQIPRRGTQDLIGSTPYQDQSKEFTMPSMRSNAPINGIQNSSMASVDFQQINLSSPQINLPSPAQGMRLSSQDRFSQRVAAGSRNTIQGQLNFGESNDQDSASPNRLKAVTNSANGGIGVSYSNVVLAGGINPREPLPIESSYKGAHDPNSYERNSLSGPKYRHLGSYGAGQNSLRAAGSQVLLK